jgi:hypothetical protein
MLYERKKMKKDWHQAAKPLKNRTTRLQSLELYVKFGLLQYIVGKTH